MLSETITVLIIVNLMISIVIQIINALILREIFYYMRSSHGKIHTRLDYLLGKVDLLLEKLKKDGRGDSENAVTGR